MLILHSGALNFLYYYQLKENEKLVNNYLATGSILYGQTTTFLRRLVDQCMIFKYSHHPSRKIFSLAACYAPYNTAQVKLASMLQGHTTDLMSADCPQGLSEPFLQKLTLSEGRNLPLAAKNCIKQMFYIRIPFYSADIYEEWKKPFSPFFWIILSASLHNHQTQQTCVCVSEYYSDSIKVLNYFPT